MSKHTAVTQNQSHFANAVHANVQRSTMMRNSTKKTTFNAGRLYPIYIDEILPGDTFEMDLNFISRLTTPIFPTMDVLNLDFYAFFVPNRIVWDGWQALQGENQSSAWVPTVPPALVPIHMENDIAVEEKGIGDYYGLPLRHYPSQMDGFSTLPFRGYNLIWNEWFRDQNLQAPVVINKGNSIGANEEGVYNIPARQVNKKHDYFTSCLPGPQKGESALIPVEFKDLIPVISGNPIPSTSGGVAPLRLRNVIGGQFVNQTQNLGTQTTGGVTTSTTTNFQGTGALLEPGNLWADGTGFQLNSTTISELRTAFQIQKLYERDARGGTRYVEMLKAHFGVDAQDYRLQRPEFLGHMHSYVGIQQVAQTSSTDTTSPQGNLAAFSYTSGSKTLFKKSFVEHGYLHIFVVARHPKTYQQGLERFWSRRDRLDFYMPVLSHISEQPVYNKEIFVSSNLAHNNEVFGYNEAWADYRYKPNQVTGQFRSGITDSLDNWHYADWYTTRPILSSNWIADNSQANLDRTLAVSSFLHDQIIMDIAFKCKATRPMPVHSIPGFVDHF